ncbi:MAG TPA: ABC transporter permease, partial [Terracidiphilus sp.]|nr:ABC transporter permease [Terracidiphilus sp.]
DVLKDESTAVAGGGRNQRLLSALVVGQIALSLALLITSGLFLQTLRAASDADPGFDRTHVLTASVGLRTAGYGDAEIRAFQHKALDQLRTLPGVQAASLTDWLPLDFNRKTADVYPEGYMPQQHRSLEVRHAGVSAGYFDTLEIPIVQGRAFTSRDDESAPRVVIVDETAAAHYWPGQSAVGRRLHIFGTWWSVVGVARNTRHLRPSEQPEPMIYLPTFQTSEPETILQVRTAGDPTVLAHPIEDMVHSINARLPVFDVRTLEETSRVAVLFERLEAIFATLFGILALILAATGIYSVVAYRTELRTHEIGIRVALGAGRNDVLRLVLWQGVRLAALGLGLGLGFAFVLTRFLRGAFYGVSATDPWTAASVTVLLAGIAVLACYLPARRAMRVDPMSAIRTL